jgi:hypothetical protein
MPEEAKWARSPSTLVQTFTYDLDYDPDNNPITFGAETNIDVGSGDGVGGFDPLSGPSPT